MHTCVFQLVFELFKNLHKVLSMSYSLVYVSGFNISLCDVINQYFILLETKLVFHVQLFQRTDQPRLYEPEFIVSGYI